MPTTVQGPDGQEFEFPDGTPPDVMKSAMRKHYGPPAAAPARATLPARPTSQPPKVRSPVEEFMAAIARPSKTMKGQQFSALAAGKAGIDLIGDLTNAAGAAIGSGWYNLTGGKSVTGAGNAPIEVQTQNGRKVYRFNGAGPWSPVPTDASGKPDLAAISQIKRPMITERATQDHLGNATAQALTFAVPGGGTSGGTRAVGEGIGLAENLAKTPLRPVVRVANKATGGKLLDPVYQAKQTLAAAIKRDGGSPEQVANIVNEWQRTGASSPSLMDAVSKLPTGGQATLAEVRGAAMNSPVARGTAKAYRNNIEANLQDNAQNLTDRLHPDQRTTQQFIDDTKALRSRNAESLYRDDYAVQLPVNKETLTGLSDAPGRSALARSRASAVANGRWDQVAEIDRLLETQKGPVDWSSRGPQFNILDAMSGKTAERLPEVPTVSGGTLDRARIQMREMAEQARRNGNNDLGRGLSERVGLIDSTLNNAPQIQNARADYGNLSGQIDMTDIGSNILSAKPSQFDYDIAALNAKARPVDDVPVDAAIQGNQDALGLSSRNALYEAIGAPGQGSTGLLNKIAGSNNLGQKLTTAFGERAAPYQAGIGNEVARLQNARAIDPNFGSQTAVRGADAGSEALNLVEGVANLKSGGLLGSAMKALREGLTLTDAERNALLELATGQADMARLAPNQTVIRLPARRGLNIAPIGAIQPDALSLPPLLSKAAAEPPSKRKRKK